MPSAPESSTAPGFFARVSVSTTSATSVITIESRLSWPIFASGRSSHCSHLTSRSSNTQSRNSMNRNTPPNAAISG